MSDDNAVTIVMIEDDEGHARLIEKNIRRKHEIQRCYDLGCNVYITKPVNYENFAQAIRQLSLFSMAMQVPETL